MNQKIHQTMGAETPELQVQRDNELIPEIGQMRVVVQRGRISHKHGSEEVDIRFERQRNDKGGVDVRAIIPKPLGIAGEVKPA